MDDAAQRSRGVNEALAQPLPAATTQREAESFEDLYERTFPRVYAYVASLVRDRAAAEDVTAQAFERAYRKRRGYRASRGTAVAGKGCAKASFTPLLRGGGGSITNDSPNSYGAQPDR